MICKYLFQLLSPEKCFALLDKKLPIYDKKIHLCSKTLGKGPCISDGGGSALLTYNNYLFNVSA